MAAQNTNHQNPSPGLELAVYFIFLFRQVLELHLIGGKGHTTAVKWHEMAPLELVKIASKFISH